MLKMHLGCGKRLLPGYINVDIQPFAGIDLQSDIRCLPIGDQSVDLFYSCANIEHISRHEWKAVLAHWYAKLKPGGALRLSTADFEAVVAQYLAAGDIGELLGLVVGGQKDAFDRHGMIFDLNYLAKGLREAGFTGIHRYDWRQTCLGKLNIDDYSQAYLPHMDKENGRLMMLNVMAYKPLYPGADIAMDAQVKKFEYE